MNRLAVGGPLGAFGRQVSRFSLVGVTNTAVDFLVTNLLFLWFRPGSAMALLAISLTACVVATGNSFLLNSRWTFGDRRRERGAMAKFLATAGVGMLVNSAVFLFLMRHLPMVGLDAGLVSLNVARLGGVVAAMAVTFAGYRFWAFAPEAGAACPPQAAPAPAQGAFPARGLLVIVGVAVAPRLAFLGLAPVIYGDAVNYAWVARLTASGQAGAADFFWHSLFDFWQVPLVWLGAGQFAAPVLASLIPGIILVGLVARVAWELYGERVALLAGTLVALHPRLIEYSLNGYAETFYLLAAVVSVWALILLARDPADSRAAVGAGLGLGTWILVRNEAAAFAVAAVALALINQRHRWRDVARATGKVATVAGVLVAAYVAVNLDLWGQTGLIEKSSNLGKNHVEMLDLRAAAQETYGASPDAGTVPREATAVRLLKRWPANVRYTAERLPGVLLSPVFLLALLLPVLGRGRPRARGVWPLVLFMAWPLVFYPFIQLEPRMLFPVLIGTLVFGSAAAVMLGERLAGIFRSRPGFARLAPAGALVALLVPLIPLLAWHSDAERGFHREVGEWIGRNVPADVQIVGDGYGYVSASAFWAGRQAEPRTWTDSPVQLARSVGDATVLIVYERFLREANPELVPVLDEGLPGMTLLAELDLPRVGRVQAWSHRPLLP